MATRLKQFGITKKDIEKDSNTALALAGATSLSAQHYLLDIAVVYTVTTSTQTMSDYAFMENVISNVNLEAGAGSKVIDLPIRDILLQNLLNRGFLSISIPKTVGTHTAKIRTVIDMTLVNMINPKDSIFHTSNFDHKVINIEGGAWDKYDRISIASAKVDLYEYFKDGAKPNVVDATGADFNVIKKPISKEISIIGTETEREIEFPRNVRVIGALVYAIDKDTNEIVSGCITNVQVKNAQDGKMKIPFDTLHEMNRMSKIFEAPTTPYFNNVVYLDFSQGEILQAPNTNDINEKDTALYLDINENGISKPKARVLFLTVDNKI